MTNMIKNELPRAKPRRVLLKNCIIGLLLANTLLACAYAEVDAYRLEADLPKFYGEFSICVPHDDHDLKYWDYVLRYHENDPDMKNTFLGSFRKNYFGWALLRSKTRNEFNLVLLDGIMLDEFSKLSPEEKNKAKTLTKTINLDIANLLYRVWIKALLSSKYGGMQDTTAVDHYYIAATDARQGPMAAETQFPVKNHTTGRIVTIARSLKDFLRSNNETQSSEMLSKIGAECEQFLARDRQKTSCLAF